jgi:glycerol-3-phosphate dehydrogenase
VRVRTELFAARREAGRWRLSLRDRVTGRESEAEARILVNATGPWVAEVLADRLGARQPARVRLVKGSHIVVPKVHPGAHACILQNTDKRVIFLLPYEGEFTLIGTTDVPLAGPDDEVACTPDEVEYLCRAVNRYLARPIGPREVVWTFAGVRPLYDDGRSDPSAITRDYVIELDVAQPRAPLLSVFGGKLTTYRKLGEAVLDRLRPSFPHMKSGWTATEPLPGGDMPGADFEALMAALASEYPKLELGLLHAIARRHGTRTRKVMGDARTVADLGRHFGHTLYEREVDLLVREEWASTAEDVLWRRTKCGLHLTPAQRESFGRWMAAR